MTQLDDLAFCLLAAGGIPNPDTRGMDLLYVDPKTSSLVSKPWTSGGEEKLGRAEVIAHSVRPNSTASYVVGLSTRLIAYVSSNNELRVCEFDDESDEWVEDEAIPQYIMHPQGHVAAILVSSDQILIIFQVPSKRFNLVTKVDGSWTSTIVPVEPTAGSPIATLTVGNQFRIFYVSAKDNCLHHVGQENGGTWKDVAVANCVFGDGSKPKRLAALPSESGFQVFVISEKNTVWGFVNGEEKLKKLGNINENKFEPDGSEESFFMYMALGWCLGCLWCERKVRIHGMLTIFIRVKIVLTDVKTASAQLVLMRPRVILFIVRER